MTEITEKHKITIRYESNKRVREVEIDVLKYESYDDLAKRIKSELDINWNT